MNETTNRPMSLKEEGFHMAFEEALQAWLKGKQLDAQMKDMQQRAEAIKKTA